MSYKLHAALGNKKRHKIMQLLSDGDKTPAELRKVLRTSQPAISQALAVLLANKLVDYEKDKTSRVYSITELGKDWL